MIKICTQLQIKEFWFSYDQQGFNFQEWKCLHDKECDVKVCPVHAIGQVFFLVKRNILYLAIPHFKHWKCL